MTARRGTTAIARSALTTIAIGMRPMFAQCGENFINSGSAGTLDGHRPPEPRAASPDRQTGRMIQLVAFLRSFSFAGQGVWHAVRTQRNMRVHLVAAAAAIAAGLALGISAVAWACVALAIGLVLVTETLNTVIEALTDLSTAEPHPLAKAAKDAAAGAVLLASVTAVGVGFAVFLPKLIG